MHELAFPAACTHHFRLDLLQRRREDGLQQVVNIFAHRLLCGPAVLLLGTTIPVLDHPLHSHHKNGVVREAEEICLLPQGFFGPLAIIDVSTRAIPLDDLSPFVVERYVADQQPPILPVRPAHAGFTFHRLARRHGGAPFVHEPGKVVGVNCRLPAPTQSLLQREPAEFKPTPIDEIEGAVRPSAPDVSRDGVDHVPKLLGLPLKLADTELVGRP